MSIIIIIKIYLCFKFSLAIFFIHPSPSQVPELVFFSVLQVVGAFIAVLVQPHGPSRRRRHFPFCTSGLNVINRSNSDEKEKKHHLH
jgi:hypothetical protein